MRWTVELVCADGRNMLRGLTEASDGATWRASVSAVYGAERDKRSIFVERIPADAAPPLDHYESARLVVSSETADEECKEIVEKTIRAWSVRS